VTTKTSQVELWKQTQEWIQDNQVLYAEYERYALDKVNLGHKFGIGQLTERVRWDGPYNASGLSEFKVPNACRRYIAIQLYDDHPEIEEFCTTNRGDFKAPGDDAQEWADFVDMLG
jgi:hypothetical protein